MNYLTQDDLDKINKWYYSPYFSLFLAFFWILYGIPLLIAIILQFTRQKKIKQLTQQYQPLIGHENTILNIIDYNQRLKKLEEEYKEKESKMNTILTANVKNLKIDVEKLKQEKQDIIKELDALKTEAITKHFDFSDFDHITSGEYKNKLAVSRLNEEQDLKNNKLISISTSINDKKFISNNTKQIVRLFNSECDSIMTKVSVKNIDSSRNKITRSFNSLNKLFETDGIKLKQKCLEIKLDQLNILYLYEMKKNQEKEIQKEIKEQMLEEEKVRREIEKQKRQIEKDQKQFNNEISRMMKYLQKSNNDAEKELYLDKIRELEEKLKELELKKETVLEREENAKAGYVYIISNIGSFGENIYKIGMTRRLEPMDRIKELSSASVPFEFDVHAMIFSQNAPELENTLHQSFREKSVNKVNYRKEFFKVTLDEIEDVVKKNYDKTVDFIKIPTATEYRQTLEIEKN
ncbi:MAG: DUF4041 domain-containing protein [Thomasclavelia spiroformis]|uniref:DUF4041 domain-containing protein n=1 Tax=Thomasclavelia spiroformis TaxID=29348 RepID=UPI003994A630